jgi:hypothetical protein
MILLRETIICTHCRSVSDARCTAIASCDAMQAAMQAAM